MSVRIVTLRRDDCTHNTEQYSVNMQVANAFSVPEMQQTHDHLPSSV